MRGGGVTYEEDDRGLANESDRRRQLALVAAAVGARRDVRVAHQGEFLQGPVDYLDTEMADDGQDNTGECPRETGRQLNTASGARMHEGAGRVITQ